MTIIAWKAVYETGIVALDNEHKGLVAEVNRLYEAIRDKRGDQVLDEILVMLDRYTIEHFQHEEQLMEEYGFPGLEEHRQKHQELNQSVQEMKQRVTSGSQDLARELFRFLREWVLHHIVEVDKKYGPHIEAHAGRFVD
jgi:hemerythrin